MPAKVTRAAWLLFFFFQALYALTSSGNAFRVPDEFEVYYQSEHLATAGDLSVPQAVARNQFFGRFGLDGKPYAPYGPLAAVLNLPHYLTARAIAAVTHVPPGSLAWTFLVSGLTMLASATAAALAVAGFYRAALLLGALPARALLLSLLLGGATVLWPYGTTLYSEAWQAAAFTWALVFLLENRAALAAAMILVAGLTKATSLVFAPGFVIFVLLDERVVSADRWKHAIVVAAGIAAAAAVHIWWNIHRFGSPMELGYNWAETVPVLPARAFAITELPRGLIVLLLSPGKSIFLWAPAVLLGVLHLTDAPKSVRYGAMTSGAIGLIFYGAYLFPEGGYAHGPRHLVPIVPLLMLPAAASTRPISRGMVAACFGVGAAIAVLAVSISFLQDQALGTNFGAVGYYERIDPAPGRAWNRYSLGYVPFVKTITGRRWPSSDVPGTGVDFFWLHIARARRVIPEARSIPGWLVWLIPLVWLGVMTAAARAIAAFAGTLSSAPAPQATSADPR